MLPAALRSLKGTLRMGRSPRMMAGTSPRSGMCSTGGRPSAGNLRVDRHAQRDQHQQDAEEDGAGLQAAAEAPPALAGGIVEDEGTLMVRHGRQSDSLS